MKGKNNQIPKSCREELLLVLWIQ